VAFYSDKAAVFRSTKDSTDFGRGVTQFGRVLYELNIDSWCANSSQAKGRVERANLTRQDRLVKKLRLRGICSREAANAYGRRSWPTTTIGLQVTEERVRRAPAGPGDEDLDLIFTWRVQRKCRCH